MGKADLARRKFRRERGNRKVHSSQLKNRSAHFSERFDSLVHLGLYSQLPGAPCHMLSFTINQEVTTFDGDETTPLLWVLRDHLDMTGTKYGCGIGQCGACTVHINGVAQRSCVVPIAAVANAAITTIEGLAASDDKLHPVQQAWLEHDVPQCGFCQPGQIMATVDFLKRFPNPSDDDIDNNITNICRCGTYARIRKAIHRAAELSATGDRK